MAKLGEVCLLKAGKFVSANDISPEYNKGLYPCFGGNGIRGYVADYTHDGEFPLIGRQGALCGNVNLASGKFHATEHAVVVQPKIEMNVHWLYYALNAMNLGQYATGAAQPGLAVSKLETLSIEIPNISEQNKIAQTLYKVEQLVNFRKQQLVKLDELVKARFVEMFGDPIGNTKNLSVTKFVDVVKMQRGFDLPVQERKSDGMIPVYGSNGVLGYHDISKVKGGGVITGRSGTIGKVFYEKGEFWPLNTTLFSLNLHGNDVVYLKYLLELFDLSRFTEGTGVPTLNRNKFHDELIIDVPLDEQERFAAFVERVDQQKQVAQQSLEKLELMKKALMQEYFG